MEVGGDKQPRRVVVNLAKGIMPRRTSAPALSTNMTTLLNGLLGSPAHARAHVEDRMLQELFPTTSVHKGTEVTKGRLMSTTSFA